MWLQKLSYMQKYNTSNLTTCICEKGMHFRSIVDTSVMACDEIISVMDIVSTKWQLI